MEPGQIGAHGLCVVINVAEVKYYALAVVITPRPPMAAKVALETAPKDSLATHKNAQVRMFVS